MSTSIFDGIPTDKLTREQECKADEQTLILHNLREAVLYTGRCCRGAIEPSELLSLCYAALSKSAPKFNPSNAAKLTFFAYSKVYLRGELSRYWKRKDAVHNAYLHETDEITPRKPSHMLCEQLYTGCHESEEEPTELPFVEPEFGAIEVHERWALVKPLIEKHLNERERTVLQLTYEAGFTFEKIGNMMVPTVVRETIRMTHDRALRKLRNALLRAKRLYN